MCLNICSDYTSRLIAYEMLLNKDAFIFPYYSYVVFGDICHGLLMNLKYMGAELIVINTAF